MPPETATLGILDITAAEHHAIRALSNSGMRHLAVSPLRYWYQEINPAPKPEEEETAALRMGTALHCAVLESEETFESLYARAIDPMDKQYQGCLETIGDMRTWYEQTTGKKPKGTLKAEIEDQCAAIPGCPPIWSREQARFYAQNQGKTVLHPDEWERLAGMAGALSGEAALKPVLAAGKPEVSMVATDPETGVLLKARLDWFAPKYTLDLKTFSQKRGVSIDKSVADAIYYERYWVQAYFYDYVRRLATGERQGDFDSVWGFVESEQPHETRIKKLLPKLGGVVNMYWEQARVEVKSLIRLYADCWDKYGEKPWRAPQTINNLLDEDVRQFAY